MFAIRLSKILLVGAIAFTCSLAAYGNIVDPAANLDFVRHVFSMDTIDPGSKIRGRAITDSNLQWAGFVAILAAEAIVALLCWLGAFWMFAAIRAPTRAFTTAKGFAVAGLTLGFLTWQTGFMGIGGEWFGMWMSETWNGHEHAFRFAMLVLGVLIYVALPEPEA